MPQLPSPAQNKPILWMHSLFLLALLIFLMPTAAESAEKDGCRDRYQPWKRLRLERQNIVGSPIGARSVGHRQDAFDPVANPWTGYTSGLGKDSRPIHLIRELRDPSVRGKVYTDLIVAEEISAEAAASLQA